MSASRFPVALPAPGVSFRPDFLPRLGRLVVRLASSAERREGAGRARLFGVGSEFVGYRSYRPGEDPRQLDWNLYARLRRPYVRVARREASEHWAILVDTSASMGLGAPGKLQRAAEVATALAACGLRVGATVDLWTSARMRFLRLRKGGELAAWMAAFEAEQAGGAQGLAALLAEPGRVRGAGRVFVVGDLLDVAPGAALALGRRGRELFFVQLLAAEELAPSTGGGPGGGPVPEGPVEWVDPENGERELTHVDRRTRTAYENLLARLLEGWRATSARHRVGYGCWCTRTPFEGVVQELLGG